jgi:hypothetical protein
MSQLRHAEAGFSAVELLITIFIAALFIGAGYQLYVAIIRDGSDARNETIASNLAYDYVRQYSTQVSNPCATTTPDPAPTVPSGAPYTSLGPASVTASITCPYAAPSGTSLITVTVSYGSTTPQKQVQHALYVTN